MRQPGSPLPVCGERSYCMQCNPGEGVQGYQPASAFVDRSAPRPSALRASFARLDPAKSGEREKYPSSPGLAAARGFGFIDRAEPARALADFHLDLRIPAAGRLVVDAFAGAVDVALDGAVGRR